MNELPEGWTNCLMGDVTEVIGGGTPDTKEADNFSEIEGIAWLTPADLSGYVETYISRGKRFLTEAGFHSSSARLLPKGAVLFSSRAPIGYVAIAANEICTNQGFKSFVPASGVIPEYLYFYLKFAKPLADDLASGTTFAEISGKNAARIPLLLAPVNEQRRIAAKLKPLLGSVIACQQRLAKILILLKRFRQAVLAAACSGELTVDWRAGNGKENHLPTGWRWITLESLLPEGGIFDGPFGSNLKTSDYTHSGVRVIRLENIDQLHFIEEKETFISQEKYKGLVKHTVGQGDVIFSSFIADEIRACVLPALKTKAIAKADCFCLRPKDDLVDRAYLALQLASRESYNALVEEVHGATRPRINTTQLRKLEIRLCPLAEQQEIVRRVEALFQLADQLETRYQKAKAHVDKLQQSILAKAFRGELVPTEAELARREGRDYEPASALLERIRPERPERARRQKEKSGPQPKPTRKRKVSGIMVSNAAEKELKQ
jgi:type I restriction enzyme S subunit